MYKVIDLFAGAGGLSLGFKQTGKYEIAAAFEINKNAQNTYKKNHEGTIVFSDVCSADYKALKKQLGKIDVVIGGPPCQGFSKANKQQNHVISQNNMLVKQYIRAVIELNPSAFVMENVENLKNEVHRFYLKEGEADTIAKYEIETAPTEILLLENRYYSTGIAEDIKNYDIVNAKLWDERDYRLLNIVYRQRNNIKKCEESLSRHERQLLNLSNRILAAQNVGEYECFNEAANAIASFFAGRIQANDIIPRIEKTIMLQRCLSRVKEIFDNDLHINGYNYENGISAIVQSYSVLDYIEKMLGAKGNGYTFKKDVVNAADFGAPQKRNRFVLIGIKKSIEKRSKKNIELPTGEFTEKNYRTVQDAIKDLENIPTTYSASKSKGESLGGKFTPTDLTEILRDSKELHNHIITETGEEAMERFKALAQGENFHSLDPLLKENTYTDISRTQNTIYQRLRYDRPSGTVLNVRKSMWIHPIIDRAISVREAARLQTFPDSFVFCGTKDAQYQQVGNAVPPILAKAIAEHLAKYLDGENNGR